MDSPYPAIDGYELHKVLGRGGAATVYEALDSRHGRSVAIKVINGHAYDEALQRRFSRELEAMGRLGDHAHIAAVYDSGFTAAGGPYFAMPLMANGALSDRIAKKGPFTPEELLDAGVKIGSAIETAHRHGVVHSDIKPSNVLIDRWGEPVLADFGISSVMNSAVTATGRTLLTILYAAPEVLDGQLSTTASDIYSFGATLYELSSGAPAYAADTQTAIIRKILSASAPPRLGETASREFADLVADMMAIEPADRPSSAAEIVGRLQELQRAAGFVPTAARFVESDQSMMMQSAEVDSAPSVHSGSTTLGPDESTLPPDNTLPPESTLPPEEAMPPAPRSKGPRPWSVAALVALAVCACVVAWSLSAQRTETPTEVIGVTVEPTSETITPTTVAATPAAATPASTTAPLTPTPIQATPTQSAAPGSSAQGSVAADLSTFALLQNPPEPRQGMPVNAHFDAIHAVDWSIGGLMATGGTDNAVRIWSDAGEFLAELPHDADIRNLQWSPDGSKLAVSDEVQLGVWDFVTAEYVSFSASANQWGLVWSHDATRLATGAWYAVTLWDVATVQQVFRSEQEIGTAWAVDLSDDGRLLALFSDGSLLEWDTTESAEPRAVYALGEEIYAGSVEYLADDTILLGSALEQVTFIDGGDGEVTREIPDEWESARVVISPTGALVAVIGQVSSIRLYDVETGQLQARLNHDGRPVARTAWSRDGTRLLAGAVDGRAHVWDVSDLDTISSIELHAQG